LIIGDTNEQDCYPETQRQIRQAAIEGRIEIWGKKEIPPRHLSSPRISSEIWSKIPPEYWRDYRLSSLATGEMWDGHDHTWAEPHITRGILAGVYWSLRVHRWEIEREWPRPRASPIKPKDDAQDEWDYLVSKKNGTGPVRDKPVGEALAYVLIGRWGERFMTAVEQGLARSNDVSQQMRQLAHDGRLRVWGRRTESGIHELIPPDYWIDHQFEWFDLLRGNGTTKQTEPPASDRRYVDLMVSRAEIEEVMPYVRPSD